jgi:SAM-dependent methyltransferase
MMAEWREGYVSDSQYISGSFFEECTPTHLNMLALLKGFIPPPTDQFTYIELGCGYGYMACIMAAVYPEGQFHVVDFNPEHIAAGQELAQQAKLTNISFHCASFADLVDRPDLLPQADYIITHGVYSWINEHNRLSIQKIVEQKLKNNGLFYVSYNALPGASTNAAIQHLIYQHGLQNPKASSEQALEGLDFIKSLKELGSHLYGVFPRLRDRIKYLERQSPIYLAHEFMNQEWRAFYFSEIYDHFTAAGLTYLTIGNFVYNDPETLGFSIKTPQEKKNFFNNPVMRETFRNYIDMLPFRMDIFIRDPQYLEPEQQEDLLKKVYVSPIRAIDEFRFTHKASTGAEYKNNEAFSIWHEKLEAGVVSIGDLCEATPDVPFSEVLRFIMMQLSSHGDEKSATLMVARSLPADPEPSRRLNHLMIQDSPFRKRLAGLAAPNIGNCYLASQEAIIAFIVYTEREAKGLLPLIPHELAAAMLAKFKERSEQLIMQGRPVEDPIEVEAQLAYFSHRFYERVLPRMLKSGIKL